MFARPTQLFSHMLHSAHTRRQRGGRVSGSRVAAGHHTMALCNWGTRVHCTQTCAILCRAVPLCAVLCQSVPCCVVLCCTGTTPSAGSSASPMMVQLCHTPAQQRGQPSQPQPHNAAAGPPVCCLQRCCRCKWRYHCWYRLPAPPCWPLAKGPAVRTTKQECVACTGWRRRMAHEHRRALAS
jgi:hypothetical protein